MISIPAISQASLSGLTAISPLSLQGVSSSTSASSISAVLLNSMSSIVQLSATGQVLSADSVLKTSLQSLQASSSAATASSVITTTQAFVAAFNQAQTSISTALPLLGSQSGATLIKQLSQTLNAAATSLAENTKLQSIGISAQTSVVPATAQTIVTLSIDQAALTTAATTNPGATQALLAQSTQSLLQQVAGFEAIATSTNGLANDSTTGIVGIPMSLLQNLSADILANAVQLGDLDLAAVGLDTGTIESATSVLNGSFSAALTAAANASAASTAATTTQSPTRTSTSTQTAANATPITAVATSAAATPAVAPQAVTATTATVTTTAATATTEATTVEQTNQAGTLAQQALLNNEAQRVINNNAFNPFYSAVIANYHLTDGATPRPANQLSEPLIPAPVIPVERVQAING